MNLTFKERCIAVIKTYKWHLIISTIIGILYSVFNSLIGFLLGTFLHKMTQPINASVMPSNLETIKKFTGLHFEFNNLTTIAIILCLVVVIKNILFVIYQFILQYLRAKLITEFRQELFIRQIEQDFHYYDKKNSGSSFAIVMDDIQIVNELFQGITRYFILNILICCALMISLCLISIKLTLITIFGTLIVSFFINLLSNYLKKKAASIREIYSTMLGSLQEMFLGIHVIKGFNKETVFISKFNKILKTYFKVELKRTVAKIASTPIQEMITYPFILLVLIIGSHYINKGQLSNEKLMQFFSIILLIAGPVKIIITEWIKIQETIPSIKRVQKLYDLKKKVVSGHLNLQNITRINIQNLSFSYDKNSKALENICLSIKENDCLGIIGESGSGKSTLTHLLLRFYECPLNSIYCNDIPIQNYRLDEWRNLFAHVPQQPFLFKDSIKNNLLIGNEAASDHELIEACQKANAWEFIQSFDNQLNHTLGENGSGLSGGQKQRIALARALLKKPSILILDEATSQLDDKTDIEIQKAIVEIKKHLILIIISHKETHMKHATHIIKLSKGKIISQGSYSEVCN